MDALLGGRAGQDVLVRMEKDVFNIGLAISSFKFLHNLSCISAVDFYDVSALSRWGDECTIWVDSNCSDLGVMGRNAKINTIIDNWKRDKIKRCYFDNKNSVVQMYWF